MRLLIAEGSPAELAEFAKQERTTADGPTGEHPIHSFITSRAGRPEVHQLAQALLDVGADVAPGGSRTSKDGTANYFAIRRAGGLRPAAAWVRPRTGRVELRLGPEDITACRFARVRNSVDDNGYRNEYAVVIDVVSAEALDEALRLVRLAIEQLNKH